MYASTPSSAVSISVPSAGTYGRNWSATVGHSQQRRAVSGALMSDAHRSRAGHTDPARNPSDHSKPQGLSLLPLAAGAACDRLRRDGFGRRGPED
jgi:hypothetical protein